MIELNSFYIEFIITLQKKEDNDKSQTKFNRWLIANFERYLKKKNLASAL